MKFKMIFSMICLSIISINAFAGKVFCGTSKAPGEAIADLNKKIGSYQVTALTINDFNGFFMICAGINP